MRCKRFGTHNFDLFSFVTFNLLSLKNDINEPFYKQKKLESHYGSVIQCNRTADPDPDLNVTDPEHGMFGLIWSIEVRFENTPDPSTKPKTRHQQKKTV